MNIQTKFLQDENGVKYAPVTTPNAVRYPDGSNLVNKIDGMQDLITDGAIIGGGYAVCSTPADNPSKTASIQDFILTKNKQVSVQFLYDLNGENPTLNISNTGAKPIFLGGYNLAEGVVKAYYALTLIYDGTAYNVVAMQKMKRLNPPSDYVDMGLPSGTLWAKRNLDVTQLNGFAASEFQNDCSFFSWGNVDGYNPISTTAFDYDFNSTNYSSTSGATLTGDIPATETYDIARKTLGSPWRLPTQAEFSELISNIDFVKADGETVIPSSTSNKMVLINNIRGIYIKSKFNGNLLFFSCSGFGTNTIWDYYQYRGYYWSSTLNTSDATKSMCFYFGNGGIYPQTVNGRVTGFACRPVQ